MKKFVEIIIVVAVLLAGYFYYVSTGRESSPKSNQTQGQINSKTTQPSAQTPETTTPAPTPPTPAPKTETWSTYTSVEFGYQVEYPKTWSTAAQSNGGFVDFGPGKIQYASGSIALDVACVFAAEVPPESDNPTTEKKTVTFGPNTFIEEETWVNQGGQKMLVQHTFKMDIPPPNLKNDCPTAMFILRKEVTSEILSHILASFKFN